MNFGGRNEDHLQIGLRHRTTLQWKTLILGRNEDHLQIGLRRISTYLFDSRKSRNEDHLQIGLRLFNPCILDLIFVETKTIYR